MVGRFTGFPVQNIKNAPHGIRLARADEHSRSGAQDHAHEPPTGNNDLLLFHVFQSLEESTIPG